MRPVSSAIGMNCIGDTMPRSGCLSAQALPRP
jgi:hypothetical protein